MTKELLPDGRTLYIYSGDGPVKPFVFEGTDLAELTDFTMQHLKRSVKEDFDRLFPEQSECE